MNVFKDFDRHIRITLERMVEAGSLPAGLDGAFTVEPPRDAAHGDIATNAALVLAKRAGMKPRDLAEAIAAALGALADVDSVEVAGPGFINLRLSDSYWHRVLAGILAAGDRYGASELGARRKVNVEYVSANPTGPMHVGHSRGAVFGDALASLLAFTGFDVTREYYINDAGAQVDALARSVHLRYREALGETVGAFADGLYPGDYLVPVGKHLAARDGDKWRDAPEGEWLAVFRREAVDAMMASIRALSTAFAFA